jgi:hypothetical protein
VLRSTTTPPGPSAQETYTGQPVEAVFATDDGIWVLFFAIVARPRSGRFEMPATSALPRDTFEQSYDAEWISWAPVRPRARLAVTRRDFPYADRVFRHRLGESEASFMRRLARSGLLG